MHDIIIYYFFKINSELYYYVKSENQKYNPYLFIAI